MTQRLTALIGSLQRELKRFNDQTGLGGLRPVRMLHSMGTPVGVIAARFRRNVTPSALTLALAVPPRQCTASRSIRRRPACGALTQALTVQEGPEESSQPAAAVRDAGNAALAPEEGSGGPAAPADRGLCWCSRLCDAWHLLLGCCCSPPLAARGGAAWRALYSGLLWGCGGRAKPLYWDVAEASRDNCCGCADARDVYAGMADRALAWLPGDGGPGARVVARHVRDIVVEGAHARWELAEAALQRGDKVPAEAVLCEGLAW